MNFIETRSEKTFLLFGFILVLVTGFFSGYSYSQEQIERHNIVIENPNESCTEFISSRSETILGSQINNENQSDNDSSQVKQQTGLFVASMNSTIYHKADCAIVKRIKDDNKIFFNSAKEAEDGGLKLHAGE